MSISYGNDYDYAYRNLVGSVITYNKEPVIVNDIDRTTGTVYARRLQNNNEFTDNLSAFDLTPIRLGYVNFNDNAYYLVRRATRQWRQGLTDGTLGNTYGVRFRIDQSLCQCVMNSYPKLESVFKYFEKKRGVRAVSRCFAISNTDPYGEKTYLINHRGVEVGKLEFSKVEEFTINPDDIVWTADYKYLREKFIAEVLNASQ